MALCEENNDGTAPTIEITCTLVALLSPTVTTEAECQSAVESCMASPPSIPNINCNDAPAPPATCPTTVGQTRACGSAIRTRSEALYARASCSNVTMAFATHRNP